MAVDETARSFIEVVRVEVRDDHGVDAVEHLIGQFAWARPAGPRGRPLDRRRGATCRSGTPGRGRRRSVGQASLRGRRRDRGNRGPCCPDATTADHLTVSPGGIRSARDPERCQDRSEDRGDLVGTATIVAGRRGSPRYGLPLRVADSRPEPIRSRPVQPEPDGDVVERLGCSRARTRSSTATDQPARSAMAVTARATSVNRVVSGEQPRRMTSGSRKSASTSRSSASHRVIARASRWLTHR